MGWARHAAPTPEQLRGRCPTVGGMPAAAARQVRGEKLVEKVLEAALEELAAKGYAAASIEEISERAGVAKTTVYRR